MGLFFSWIYRVRCGKLYYLIPLHCSFKGLKEEIGEGRNDKLVLQMRTHRLGDYRSAF